MASEVENSNFANQYRPSKFSEVVGQELVVESLKKIAKSDGVSVRSIFLKGSYGSGKCIYPNQRVVTEMGYRRIVDLHSVDRCGFVPLNIKVETPYGFQLATHSYKEAGVECYFITTKNGHTITGTANHPVFSVIGDTMSLFKIRELREGDSIVFNSSSSKIQVSCINSLLATSFVDYLDRGGEVQEVWFDSRDNAFSAIVGFISVYSPSMSLDSEQIRTVLDLFDYLNCPIHVTSKLDSKYYVDFRRKSVAPLYNLLKNHESLLSQTPFSEVVRNFTLSLELVLGSGYLESDIMTSSIVSITKMVCDVYDISVPESHLFMSAGVINHNTTLSRIFAKALNCEQFKKTGEVCNECASCKDVMSPISQLYMELDATRAGNVDSIRELTDSLSIVPPGRRLVCLDEIHACFEYTQKVWCVGDSGNLYDLEIGDIVENKLPVSVLSINPLGEMVKSKVLEYHKIPNNKPLLKVTAYCPTLGITTSAVSTPDHKYLTDSGYQCLESLSVGDVLVGRFPSVSVNSQVKLNFSIISIEEVDSTEYVYDLGVEDTHNYFVDYLNVHNCSNQALNALLKVVEEGVPNTIFIFCSTEDILPTIKSRSLCLDITPIPANLVEQKIKEVADSRGINITKEELSVLSMKCQGHMRDAYQYLQLYEIAGPRGLDSSYNLFRSLVFNTFSTNPKKSPYLILEEILKYPISDIKLSIGAFIRNVFTANEGTPEYKLHQSGIGLNLFSYFFTPLAQQAMREEVGMEILLRAFLDKAIKK